MNTPLIIPGEAPETCGTCKFHHPIATDLNMIECRGTPPTPCIVAMTQTIRGPEFQIELMRPRLPRMEKACALWRRGKVHAPMAS